MLYKQKIYIVDDNTTYMEMIREALTSKIKNLSFKLFSNTQDFLKDKNLEEVDLFIVDIRLVNTRGEFIDGRDICRLLPISCVTIPFLFVSGYPITDRMFKNEYKFQIYDFINKTDGIKLLINRAKVLLFSSQYKQIINSKLAIPNMNTLTYDDLKEQWANTIKKDRIYISSFISQINNHIDSLNYEKGI